MKATMKQFHPQPFSRWSVALVSSLVKALDVFFMTCNTSLSFYRNLSLMLLQSNESKSKSLLVINYKFVDFNFLGTFLMKC
jgi:hypothetical protein